MACYPSIRGIDNSRKAVIQCVKLLGQKNLESISHIGNGIYSHTNASNIKRMFVPCITLEALKKQQELYPHANYMKCSGYYILYWTA